MSIRCLFETRKTLSEYFGKPASATFIECMLMAYYFGSEDRYLQLMMIEFVPSAESVDREKLLEPMN